ncbi:MAG TPA: hypothetical protein VMI54_18685 [Polyangiaceae bacterium]|nr:hypothetical protein [Polyangiaceae bacterium]
MSLRTLGRILGAYFALLLVASWLIAAALGVDRRRAPAESVVSVWSGGKRRARAVVKATATLSGPDAPLGAELRRWRGMRTVEDIVDTSRVLSTNPLLFGASFVPGRDGVKVTLGDRVAYATSDDLLALKAYDHPLVIGPIRLQLGVDPDVVWDALAGELGVSKDELLDDGEFTRLALRHRVPPEPAPKVTRASLRDAAVAAGRYLANAVKTDGTYRYEVNAVDNEEHPGYNWPRHAGATWYLAESAIYAQDPPMIDAAERAARRLAEGALVACGSHRCVAEGDRADLGSSALGLLALSEIVEGKLMPELMPAIRDLAAFIRSQQRPDGEFMHFYDRQKNEPEDVQVLYYTGEAAFALGRAARLTGDPKDVEAASRALDHLVTTPGWYAAAHYYYGAEHWTCHAMDELWERAPNPKALRFCLEWQEMVRNTAIRGRAASPEYDGATSAGPFVPPALVGTATRMEAAVATLRVARLANVPPSQIAALQAGIDDALAFLMRFELNPGPSAVMVNPGVMRGGFPNTPTDLDVRIDYPQHAGTALLGYLKQLEQRGER